MGRTTALVTHCTGRLEDPLPSFASAAATSISLYDLHLLAVLFAFDHAPDEDPALYAGAGALEASVMRLYGVEFVILVGRCADALPIRACYELDQKRLRNAGNGNHRGTKPTVESAFLCDFRSSS